MPDSDQLDAPDSIQSLESKNKEWKYLTPSKHFWRKQLFVMGRKVPASDVWSAMLANNQTIDEVAAVWNIPNQAVVEIIEYCQANQKLLAEEEAEELRLSKTWGVGICTYS